MLNYQRVAPRVGPPIVVGSATQLGFLRWYGLILVMSFVAGTTQAIHHGDSRNKNRAMTQQV